MDAHIYVDLVIVGNWYYISNSYIIKGVFQKKEDTYRDKYVTVSKRPDTFRDANEFSNALEYSKERLEIMLNYLEENARKSNRY